MTPNRDEEDKACFEFRLYRVLAGNNLREWLGLSRDEYVYAPLAKLIGYPSPSMVACQWEHDYSDYIVKLKQLAGTHGHAVWKAMLINQKEMSCE